MQHIKINIGSGNQIIEGWISIDNVLNIRLSRYPFLKFLLYKLKIISKKTYNNQWDKRITKHDIRKKLPFIENTVDYVYSSHTLEHFTQDDALVVCRNVYTALKPGGLFRVVVPDDLKYIISKYVEGDFDYFSRNEPIANQFINAIKSNIQCEDKNRFVYKKKTGGSIPTFAESFFNKSAQHKWMYDSDSLKYLLITAGFDVNKIHEFEYKHGQCPDLDKLENRKDNNIFLEGIK